MSTLTTSVTCPSGSSRSTRARVPALSLMAVRRTRWNPGLLASKS
jgi:hypothetical protein